MQFRDTEGAPIPEDDKEKGWNLTLWGDFEMSMSIPQCIDLGDNYYVHGGAHVFSVSIRDILEEYLENHEILDGKDCLRDLANLLREYADKYESSLSG